MNAEDNATTLLPRPTDKAQARRDHQGEHAQAGLPHYHQLRPTPSDRHRFHRLLRADRERDVRVVSGGEIRRQRGTSERELQRPMDPEEEGPPVGRSELCRTPFRNYSGRHPTRQRRLAVLQAQMPNR